jgi:UDP:flavonoid glycosyltransferase YjiC (YdhE family)
MRLVHSHLACRSCSFPKAPTSSTTPRVVAAGAGIQLLPDSQTADCVRDALSVLLHDDTFREAADRIKNELDAMPEPRQAVETLEQLAQ